MSKLLSILAGVVITSTSIAEGLIILDFKYDSNKQIATLVSQVPSNTTAKIQYSNTLGTNAVWRDYGYILKQGVNTNAVYSPSSERFFRLKQR